MIIPSQALLDEARRVEDNWALPALSAVRRPRPIFSLRVHPEIPWNNLMDLYFPFFSPSINSLQLFDGFIFSL